MEQFFQKTVNNWEVCYSFAELAYCAETGRIPNRSTCLNGDLVQNLLMIQKHQPNWFQGIYDHIPTDQVLERIEKLLVRYEQKLAEPDRITLTEVDILRLALGNLESPEVALENHRSDIRKKIVALNVLRDSITG